MKLITGVDHVNLLIDTADDALDRARAFYQDLLGLERSSVLQTRTADAPARGINAVFSNCT
jgi:catechol 2,3-dioxygenase-like lactoylglutathione lyase family enzyme